MALYMFIALFSGMVMSSVIEEKSSRVVEVLMSSVKATELMFGKIIGVALVALTQFLLWILLTLMLIGFFIAFYAFRAPESSIVWWGSMIPFTSPIVMLARLPFGVPMWELCLSIGLLILTFFACAWASAKIYKVGILMFGKKSTFKDLWNWLKQK